MKSVTRNLLLLLLVCSSHVMAKDKQKIKVDLIISNGTIYTVDDKWHVYEAMAINNGKIIALGSNKKILDNYQSTQKINADKKFVYPGFIDAHCHFSAYALDKNKCELVDTRSYAEVISRVTTYAKTNTLPWIYGRGWDQNKWPVKEFPTKDTLDELFPDIPVILQRVDGHALLCNDKALKMAKITSKTKIRGGEIEKDKDGEPTGVLIDNAMEPVERLISTLPREQAVNYMVEAENDCYAEGLTGVVDCGVTKRVINMLRSLYSNDTLTIGNYVMLNDDTETLNAYVTAGPQQFGQLHIIGIKMYADGALGSRGACMKEDYTDKPGHRGLILAPIKHYEGLADTALQYNMQLCTHAIGDSANSTVLKLYMPYLGGKNDKRWRIEHAQIVDPEDQKYFREYSVIPSVQPTHATSDSSWAAKRIGIKRMAGAYAYNDLLKQAGYIALGTDFPVEAISPIATFYTAVYRTNTPKGVAFMPKNALKKKDALRGMTIWAAKSVFKEKEKGSLEVGKDADIVILNKDLLKAEKEQILKTKVIYTIMTGKIKYKR